MYNTFYHYCKYCKLDINFSKTKSIIVGDIMCRHRHKSIHGHNMEVVDIYTYRVFIFPKNASFSQTKKAYHRKKKKSFILLILSRL